MEMLSLHLIQTPLKELREHKEEHVLIPAQVSNSCPGFWWEQ